MGLFLPDAVSGHGQLYVSASHTTDGCNLLLCFLSGEHFAFGSAPREPNTEKVTVHVTYDEIL